MTHDHVLTRTYGSKGTNKHLFMVLCQIIIALLIYYFADPEWDTLYNRGLATILFIAGLLMLFPIVQSRCGYGSGSQSVTHHIDATHI
jgi:hypothetical protein